MKEETFLLCLCLGAATFLGQTEGQTAGTLTATPFYQYPCDVTERSPTPVSKEWYKYEKDPITVKEKKVQITEAEYRAYKGKKSWWANYWVGYWRYKPCKAGKGSAASDQTTAIPDAKAPNLSDEAPDLSDEASTVSVTERPLTKTFRRTRYAVRNGVRTKIEEVTQVVPGLLPPLYLLEGSRDGDGLPSPPPSEGAFFLVG